MGGKLFQRLKAQPHFELGCAFLYQIIKIYNMIALINNGGVRLHKIDKSIDFVLAFRSINIVDIYF